MLYGLWILPSTYLSHIEFLLLSFNCLMPELQLAVDIPPNSRRIYQEIYKIPVSNGTGRFLACQPAGPLTPVGPGLTGFLWVAKGILANRFGFRETVLGL